MMQNELHFSWCFFVHENHTNHKDTPLMGEEESQDVGERDDSQKMAFLVNKNKTVHISHHHALNNLLGVSRK
jgi:hypothetical protein